MNIIVISDTHLPRKARTLPEPLLEALANADLILHAGDWSDWDVYKLLSTYAPVEGVAGNTDPPEIGQKLGFSRIVEADGLRLGLVHGHLGAKSTEQNAIHTFAGQQVDAVTFGHSHIPVMHTVNDVLIFNPGSPTDRRRQPQYSFGILTTELGKLQAEHVFFDKK
ncbi:MULTISPECIES: metallophosphoesterase family protein [unclassified Paenibacillus]|uniref:metallophosphoesterase family protein n=1 Tax=unclassified Paenibacillus TaxID=185978 RepID=UPI0003F79992|nr:MULTISPECIES: metallophosphoesterase [unclassified Paenibacillus]KGP81894.1 phosphodiesterase [Paenibacillus sp. MAEPY1]KGP82981.1 phosphodiesterase [Paenibacillus sp. MAEPY2]